MRFWRFWENIYMNTVIGQLLLRQLNEKHIFPISLYFHFLGKNYKHLGFSMGFRSDEVGNVICFSYLMSSLASHTEDRFDACRGPLSCIKIIVLWKMQNSSWQTFIVLVTSARVLFCGDRLSAFLTDPLILLSIWCRFHLCNMTELEGNRFPVTSDLILLKLLERNVYFFNKHISCDSLDYLQQVWVMQIPTERIKIQLLMPQSSTHMLHLWKTLGLFLTFKVSNFFFPILPKKNLPIKCTHVNVGGWFP